MQYVTFSEFRIDAPSRIYVGALAALLDMDFKVLTNLVEDQFKGKEKRDIPSREDIEEWMELYPSGLEPQIIELRESNKRRILKIIIAKMDEGEISDPKYRFETIPHKAGHLPALRPHGRG